MKWKPFGPPCFVIHGGVGSGNFGHAGRPGRVGGSAASSSRPSRFSAPRGRRGARDEVDRLLNTIHAGSGNITDQESSKLISALMKMTVADLRTLAIERRFFLTGGYRKQVLVDRIADRLKRRLQSSRDARARIERERVKTEELDRLLKDLPGVIDPEGRFLEATHLLVDRSRMVRQTLAHLFGRDLSDGHLGAMGAVPDGASMSVHGSGGTDPELETSTEHDGITSNVRFSKNNDTNKTEAYISLFKISESSPHKGTGFAIVANQVLAMQAAGIERIDLYAAGSYGHTDYNGYYTWPRLGWDVRLTGSIVMSLPTEIREKLLLGFDEKKGTGVSALHPSGKTLLDLYEIPEGREWWKRNGGGVNLTFDTTPGSKSMKTLLAYAAERRARAGYS